MEAVLRDQANNKRLIVAEGQPMKMMGLNLVEKYGRDYPISKGVVPGCLLKFGSVFSKQAKFFSKKMGKEMIIDAS